MAPKAATGQVLERDWKSGRGYALRFYAYGERHYVTLGTEEEGWTKEQAEVELMNVMADVRRGIWQPPEKTRKKTGQDTEPEEREVPMFGEFARSHVAGRRGEVSEGTSGIEEWALEYLLEFFADRRLTEIDVQAVDEFRRHMLAESEARKRAIENRRPRPDRQGNPLRPLSARTINMVIGFLSSILAVAVEYGHIDRNPAIGRRRRLKAAKKPPIHLDSPAQIEALLRAADQMDRNPRYFLTDRLPVIATLIFAGPRAHELCHLAWRDIDLANARITVGRSKTQAGLREIKMAPILRDILAAHKARSARTGPDDLAFPTVTGGPRDKTTLLQSVLGKTFAHANELLQADGQNPLPQGLTTHKLRHTFASILIACGEDPISLMTQIGHTDPGFTLRVYAHTMNRDPEERARLKTLVKGERPLTSAAARPLRSTDYEQPILDTLIELGGTATRQEVARRVRQKLSPRMTPTDLKRVPSGMHRWETHLSKARSNLVAQGRIKPGSSRGRWELTAPDRSPRSQQPSHLTAFPDRS